MHSGLLLAPALDPLNRLGRVRIGRLGKLAKPSTEDDWRLSESGVLTSC
jgi:hypothetical protein